MNIKEVVNALERFAPLPLQEGFDNAGLQVGLTETQEVSGALLCLDVTEKVVDEAVAKGCNLIVSHHPLLFHALKKITGKDDVQRAVVKAIKHDITVVSMHTNMDNALGGVNYKIAEKMGLQEPRFFGPEKTVGDVNLQETENLMDFLVYEGPIDPTWYGSLNNGFTYMSPKFGKLDLDVYITYSGGNMLRLDPVFSYSYSDLSSFPREFKNRWMNAGDEAITDIPVIASISQVDRYGENTIKTAYNAYNYSTDRVAKGDFVRLKEVSLTYTFPQGLLKKSGLFNAASIKLAATNLCLLYADKKLNGQDPEFINSGGVSTPISKQFTATVRLGF